MEQFISQLARQSVAAGWVILALVLLRPLLKKLPRACACLLWALAAVRLLVPSVVKSPVSLMPQRVADPAAFIPITPTPMIAVPSAQAAAQAAAPAARSADQVISSLLPWLWLAGAVAMGLYALYSYIHLINRVKVSIRMGDRLYISDNVASPFILGIIRPKIYLPSEMDQDQAQLVLAHERSHLRRGDHLWKPLGYTLLCLHWFNPLCWVAYLLFCRDMEQACDEAVIKDMPAQEKKAYSTALLNCSLPRSAISACPLAFGEVGVKQRIRGVLNYRKPKFWVLVISGLVCVTLAACFLTDPVKGETPVAEPTGSGKETVSPNLNDFQIRFETTIYAYPTSESRAVGTLTPGEAYTIAQTENVGKGIWGHIHVEGSQIDGWILLGTEVDPSEGKSDTADAITSILAGAIRSNPSVGAQEIGQIDPDKVYTVLRREQIGNQQWAFVQCGEITGWVLLNEEEEAGSNGQTEEPGASGPIITDTTVAFPQGTILRSGPADGAREMGEIAPNEVCPLLRRELIAGRIWAYVQNQSGEMIGWVLLGEEKEVGQTEEPEALGEEPGASDAITFSREVSVRVNPSYDAWELGKIAPGEVCTALRREQIGNQQWVYVQNQSGEMTGWVTGWVLLEEQAGSGEQTQAPGASGVEPGVSDPGDAIAFPQGATLRSSPSDNAKETGKAAPGEVCTVLRREQIGNKQWAFVQPQRSDSLGWLLLNGEEETVSSAERFSQKTDIHSTPSEQSEVLYQADAGEEYTIIRREFVEGSYWVYVRTQNGATVGWVYLKDESEALNYFWEYAIAHMRETPDAAEEYLYFATEDAREYFRYMYAPATGWATNGIFQVNENLWSIRFADIQSQQADYSFVGRMDDRLYVFQTVHDVPEALRENLDVAAYEEPNGMYVSDEWKAGFLISTRLMAFAEPAQVEIAGDKDYSNASAGLSFADMVCGTDTWQKAELPQAGKAGCTITLHAADGSTAVLSDATPAIVVTYPDGTQEAYQDYATGEENIAMIYNWAKELAQ